MTEFHTLRLARRLSPVNVLGPGSRAVLWVQGCPMSCPGCIAPESRAAEGGEMITVAELADWVRSCGKIEGVTISGGEPFVQAEALCQLIDVMRGSGLGWMSYTGFSNEWLLERGTDAQRELLSNLDLLVDGPYLRERHADLLWRGSSNQRLIPITERYRKLVAEISPETDRSAGLEISIDEQGKAVFTGVPADPEFRDSFG